MTYENIAFSFLVFKNCYQQYAINSSDLKT